MVAATAFQAAFAFTTNHRSFLRKFAQRSSLLASYNSAAALPNTNPLSPQVVSVFDNVLSPACCTELTTDKLYNIGPDVYRRNDGAYSPQDVLIESILVGLGSEFKTTKEVEWWGRSTYKSVEAHRDVDEEAASSRGERRYPTHSLIVYLDVEEGIRAPTCLWVPSDDDEANNKRSTLLAVPIVPGRLLVFSGELLHGVPYPALHWLDPAIKNAISHNKDHETMRRVLVLNLWDDHAPKDEEWLDYVEDGDDWDDDDDLDDEEDEDEQGPIEFFAKRVECEPRSSWQSIALQEGPLTDGTTTPATLSTNSHGSDEPLLSFTKSHAAMAQVLESKSVPRWLWTGADVSDLGIGVPSVAGSREERFFD